MGPEIHYPPSADTPERRRTYERMVRGLRSEMAAGKLDIVRLQYQCQDCGERFASPGGLGSHRKTRHK